MLTVGRVALLSYAAAATTVNGTAAGSYTFTGTITGTREVLGTAAGSYTFTGTANGSGAANVTGVATGTYTFTATASGLRKVYGTATGNYTFTGTAIPTTIGTVQFASRLLDRRYASKGLSR